MKEIICRIFTCKYGQMRHMLRMNVIGAVVLCVVMSGGCGKKESVAESELESMAAVNESDEKNTGDESSENISEEIPESTGVSGATEAQPEAGLPDGTYTAKFQTDSSMFRVSEVCDGRGTLTVENGKMTLHISLGSKKIVNLYPGFAEDAAKDGAELLQPTEDTVTYSDGMTEEVYGFDIPVPALDTEFDLALIGTKEKWYDHKVSVSDPVALEDSLPVSDTGDLADGTYMVGITFEGGSGKAKILSPVSVTITDGKVVATVQWNSPNYDYMIVGGDKYLPVNTEGDSVFEIPVVAFDQPMEVIGDTVAMSKPHEVEYTLTFHSDTIEK